MVFGQVSLPILEAGESLDTVVNITQLRYARDGGTVTVGDQDDVPVTNMIFMDGDTMQALVPFDDYKIMFGVENSIMNFNPSLIPIQP